MPKPDPKPPSTTMPPNNMKEAAEKTGQHIRRLQSRLSEASAGPVSETEAMLEQELHRYFAGMTGDASLSRIRGMVLDAVADRILGSWEAGKLEDELVERLAQRVLAKLKPLAKLMPDEPE